MAAWIGLLLVSFLVGVAILPVRTNIRWLVLLLAAQSWPFLYGIKLGQAGLLPFLLFAIGWRWLDTRPVVLGMSAGLGAAIRASSQGDPRLGAAHARCAAVGAFGAPSASRCCR